MATLRQLIKKYKDNHISLIRLSCGTMTGKVVTRTPVGDEEGGSLRASWNANNGGPVARNVNISSDNPFAGRNNHTDVANSLNVGDTYTVVNGQPYGPRIEFEGWSHSKAPAGMMRVSLAEWDSVVKASIQ